MTEECVYKVLLLGDTTVGKTCFLMKYTDKTFQDIHMATIGLDYRLKSMKLKSGKNIKLQIWDTAGQDRFRAITKNYYKGSHGIILIYDVTNIQTFENVKSWVNQIREEASTNVIIYIAANKIDMEEERKVSKEEGEEKAKYHNVAFLETSALNGTNIEKAFQELINDVYHNNKGDFKKDVNLLLDDKGMDISEPKKEEKGCCG